MKKDLGACALRSAVARCCALRSTELLWPCCCPLGCQPFSSRNFRRGYIPKDITLELQRKHESEAAKLDVRARKGPNRTVPSPWLSIVFQLWILILLKIICTPETTQPMKKDLGCLRAPGGLQSRSLPISHDFFYALRDSPKIRSERFYKQFCAPKIGEWKEENEGRSGERKDSERRKRRGQYSQQLRGGTRRQLNSRDISKFDMEYETLVASQPKIAVFWPFEH